MLLIVTAGLALWAGQAESSRRQLREYLATRQVALLQEALTVYYLDQGTFPAGREDFAAAGLFANLRAVPACNSLLLDWPALSDIPAESEPIDAWRHPYRYISRENDRWRQVADNGGWPLFVSAGPDGQFGSPANPAAEVDNRRTDEVPAR